MPQPRRDAPAENRERELRKIAAGLRDLAKDIEAEEENLHLLHARRAMTAQRQIRCRRTADSLLLDTLAHGGPEEEQLRIILRSWQVEPNPTGGCFAHVCRVWKPLRELPFPPTFKDLKSLARALRIIADGVTQPTA